MRYVYICGAIPEKVCDALRQSVAGNKFSINMARAIDECCGGNLTFISTSSVYKELLETDNSEIWPGKKLLLAQRGKRFILTELKLRRSVMQLLSQIREKHPGEALTVFVENSPFAVATAVIALKKKLNMSCYSITIDTPFAGEFRKTGLKGKINSWMFQKGQKALRKFDGLISFTEDVKKDLQVDIPFCKFAIGCKEEAIPEQLPELTQKKTAVYAGTLIYYNGIQELLRAFSMLGSEYQLHIYGYGPLEHEVRKAAEENENIYFHGRFNPEETAKILEKYELLINPRRIDSGIENFTFPSKLVDYILTGKSVLSSNFKTLPPAYREFVYILEDLQPGTIAQGVRRVFGDTTGERQSRGREGIRYIKKNQTYQKIAGRILEFVEA